MYVEFLLQDGSFCSASLHPYDPSDPSGKRAAIQLIHEVDGADYLYEVPDEAKEFYALVVTGEFEDALNYWSERRTDYQVRFRHLKPSPTRSENDLRAGAQDRLAGVVEAEEEDEEEDEEG